MYGGYVMNEELQDIESQVVYDPDNVAEPIEFEKTEAPNE
jgi:hypothetical protein